MVNKLLKISDFWAVGVKATTFRTIVFTVGHFFIDVFVIALITGAPIETATLASIVGPIINGIWYWILDRLWTQTHYNEEHPSVRRVNL